MMRRNGRRACNTPTLAHPPGRGGRRGEDESFLEAGAFWSEEEAQSECERLQGLQTDLTIRYEALMIEATVVHPADESPPWVPDPDRLRRRGYELPEPTDPQAS
jgi:hypothetical protein